VTGIPDKTAGFWCSLPDGLWILSHSTSVPPVTPGWKKLHKISLWNTTVSSQQRRQITL